jgi:4-hydroxy-2-oxoheptanedioate aldolase
MTHASQTPVNTFKQALREGKPQIGLWVALADPYVAELLAGTGFDWLLLDAEHGPNDVRSVLAQLQAVSAYPVHPVVRPVIGETVLIKQYLDLGAQTLLLPMVESARQAAQIVSATRYPPQGVRGMGSAIARASRWNKYADYLQAADDQMCVLVQVETAAAAARLDEIAAVPGVDGVFFGPGDLSASMGHRGNPGHPEVQRVIESGIQAVKAAGKAPGILTADAALARRYLELGALFVAVGADTSLISRAARDLATAFRGHSPSTNKAGGGY